MAKTATRSTDVTLLPGQRTTVLRTRAPFSWNWVWASFAGFLVFQVVLGQFAGTFLLRGYHTEHMRFLVEGSINLGAYYLGGFLVGFISPGARLYEPAVAAGLAMLATLTVGWFTPSFWYQFGMGKFILGGGLAAFCAYCGAFSAEKMTGNVTEEE